MNHFSAALLNLRSLLISSDFASKYSLYKLIVFSVIYYSNYEELKRDGKLKSLKTIFIEDRMDGKTEKTNMYIFDKTTYHKELILKNRKYYRLKARKIGKDTI